MSGETVSLLNDMELEESYEHAIIVFAHLMYLHKQAFENCTAPSVEPKQQDKPEHSDVLSSIQEKSRNSIKSRAQAPAGEAEAGADATKVQERLKNSVPSWVRVLSEKTAGPWESLEKLRSVWKDPGFDVPAVCAIVGVLGPCAYQFLDSLAVKVPRHVLRQRCLQREHFWKPVRSFPGELGRGNDPNKPEGNDPNKPEGKLEHLDVIAPAAEGKRTIMQGLMQGLMEGRNKIEVEIHFCHFANLVQYPSVVGGAPRQQLELAVALLDADERTALFATPVGQALAGNFWDVAFPLFVRQKIMDAMALFVLIFLISPVSHTMQTDGQTDSSEREWPEGWKISANLFFASLSALNIVFESIMVCTHRSFWRAYVNWYNVCSIFVESWSVAFVCSACHDYWLLKHDNKTWESSVLYLHPMAFGCLIFMKWLQWMISMLSFNGLSSALLPAWFAIKSPESVVFLFYLFLLSLGSCFAYYALPLDLGRFPQSHFEAFFRMIRLGFLGDFDMDQLEGKKMHINNKTWMIEEDEGVTEIQNSLKGFVMVLGLFFPVILLNVYVGLLSEEYKKAKDNQAHLTASFRTASVFRLHLHRLFWYKCSLCPYHMSLDCFRQSGPAALEKAGLKEDKTIQEMGTWILTPARDGMSPSAHNHGLLLDVSNALLSHC